MPLFADIMSFHAVSKEPFLYSFRLSPTRVTRKKSYLLPEIDFTQFNAFIQALSLTTHAKFGTHLRTDWAID